MTAYSILRLVLVGGAVVLLGACASNAQLKQNTGDVRENVVKQSEGVLDNNGRLMIEGVGEVSVHSTYTSASGRQCRRLVTAQGQLLSINSCKRKGGDWYYTRSLNPVNVSVLSGVTPLVNTLNTPAEAPDAIAVQSAVAIKSTNAIKSGLSTDTVGIALIPGETLWTFASRVTGNAMNWKKIAELNGIVDARSLEANQTIEVQTSLVKADL